MNVYGNAMLSKQKSRKINLIIRSWLNFIHIIMPHLLIQFSFFYRLSLDEIAKIDSTIVKLKSNLEKKSQVSVKLLLHVLLLYFLHDEFFRRRFFHRNLDCIARIYFVSFQTDNDLQTNRNSKAGKR